MCLGGRKESTYIKKRDGSVSGYQQLNHKKGNNMILHCMICSLGGTHINSDSAIAVVDMEKLDLPLDSSMFTSLMPERELPPPWQPGADWQNMKCPRGNHLPWGIELDETDQAMKDGGPKQILTDEGFVETKKQDEANSFKMMSSSVIIDTEKNEVVETKKLFKCDYCPKADIKSLAGKMAHERHCKKKKGII